MRIILMVLLFIISTSCNKEKKVDLEEKYDKYKKIKKEAWSYEDKSVYYFKNNDLKNAEDCALKFKENIILSKDYYDNINKDKDKYNNIYLTGYPMMILGFIYYDRGEYEKAADHFKKAFGKNFLSEGAAFGEWYFYLLALIKANKVLDNQSKLEEIVKTSKRDFDIRMPIFYYTYAKYLYEKYKEQSVDVNKEQIIESAIESINKGIRIYHMNIEGYKVLSAEPGLKQDKYEIIKVTEFSFEPDVKAEILKQFRLNVSLEEMESLKSEIEKEMKK